jgi:hypothetical protein
MRFLLIFLFLCLICNDIIAHPVIWKDGFVISSMFTEATKEIKAHYSITHKWSLGLHGIELNDVPYGMVQSNFLLKRWNGEGSQGNLYLFSGVGTSLVKERSMITHLGFQADWETRTVHTHLRIDSYFEEKPTHLISTRFGFAPYLVDYEALSTWIILQVDDKVQDNEHHISMMPVLRLFKDNILLEFGSNFSNKYLITAMIHF